jgi:hypothetical protein
VVYAALMGRCGVLMLVRHVRLLKWPVHDRSDRGTRHHLCEGDGNSSGSLIQGGGAATRPVDRKAASDGGRARRKRRGRAAGQGLVGHPGLTRCHGSCNEMKLIPILRGRFPR